MEEKDKTMVEHYETVRNLGNDFRNFNLFHLASSLVSGKTVVDIGCGSGHFASILKAFNKDVIGIEPSAGMRALAARSNPGVVVMEGSAEEVDVLLKKTVDSIVMLDVLEHVKDDGNQVKKINECLKENGEFVFVVPAHPYLYGKRDMQMGHYRRYTKKALCKILETNGFSLQYVRYWNALGVLPYMVSEKILRRPLRANLRKVGPNSGLHYVARKMLHWWFAVVEKNCNFGFGLSLVGVAKKTSV
ncbi:MAG: hypothetical protein COV10_02070 [Candidatus Vogelbacteria bacterium CG10_big_fil_rev_8_21_14_0_10_51_16]|uniref:Methyltransferase type 11 domain-containing protein n=1 Tax=Candidatus Vogelbacteria bacterium CG10_big_fil_rev_8_21_14_0_10_51_16 TaxID=1975045 RepID=A0A2H0REJ1_9BACT|nr:MAG: hypothetical protein COV10_02070 [Candidatus Vogelbacteria bacterium CG10_big_fil_rev_8_21_14_0_10_51_16]